MSGRRILFGLWILLAGCPPLDAATVRIGSKAFTESYVLAEIALRTVENAGVKAVHRPGMGGTIVLWQALRSGGIDSYPDYTGTIGEQILSAENPLSHAEMRRALAEHGVGMTASLGFDNTYALVMRRDGAERLGMRTISDLAVHRDLEVGLTHEFMERRDGWRTLAAHYGLEMQNVRGLEHALAYPALARGDLDVIDAYSTDAKLAELDLVALTDDLGFFPRYEAVFLYRLDLEPAALQALESLAGTLDETRMIRLNAAAEKTHDYTSAADLYFGDGATSRAGVGRIALRITGWTLRHLQLVAVSLGLAILIGVPLGIRAAYLIVPFALGATAHRLVGGNVVPTSSGTNVPLYGAGRPRPLIVVEEAQLDADSTTAWYLAANSGVVETVEVTFLQGEESPVLAREDGFTTDTIKYKIRQTFAAKAIDFRGLYQGNA